MALAFLFACQISNIANISLLKQHSSRGYLLVQIPGQFRDCVCYVIPMHDIIKLAALFSTSAPSEQTHRAWRSIEYCRSWDRPSRLEEIEFAHKRYSEQHLKNSKTKRVLASAFDEDFAEDYMTKVMFDTA